MRRAMRVERKTEVRNGIKRGVFALFAIVVELIWVYIGLRNLTGEYSWIPFLIQGLAFVLVLGIYGRHINAAMKMPWILLIAGAPFLGVPLYLLMGFNGSTQRMRRRYEIIDEHLFPAMPQQGGILEELESVDYGIANQFRYLSDRLGYPVYRDTDICFYPTAEEAFEAQLEALKKAERFIFMEYHAIEEKTAFERLFEVLSERAAAGVEVRLFYDDIGSIWFIDHDFIRRMEEAGIEARVFNPMTPIFNAFLNHRDHRKITVIDGKVGFTGGYNLAEEYFNITHPYGHWFDTGIRLTGEAVRSLTGIFLENWNAIRGEKKGCRKVGGVFKAAFLLRGGARLLSALCGFTARRRAGRRECIHEPRKPREALCLLYDALSHHHRRDEPGLLPCRKARGGCAHHNARHSG